MIAIDSVEALVARARDEGTPITEGDTATFVWLGTDGASVMGDFNHWGWGTGGLHLQPVAEGVWTGTTALPRDAYVEYALNTSGGRSLDPLNPHTTADGLGGINNYFYMPENAETPLIHYRRGTPRGKVTRHVVYNDFLVVGGKRVVRLYRPKAEGPYPLMVVLDGQDFLHRARLVRIVDNLIAQGRIPPIGMALVDHGAQARFVEYDCSDSTVAFLARSVLPLATEHLDLIDIDAHPGSFGVMGASMGGLMSLYVGMRMPEVFGRVLSQSGSYGLQFRGHPPVVWDLVERDPVKPIAIWMDVGRFESLLEPNRWMYGLLRDKGYDVTLREHDGGHNYAAWRNNLWRGLEVLFPPKGVVIPPVPPLV